MTEPEVRLELATRTFRPGDELTGAFVLAGGATPDTRSVEFSVVWHTSGRGTEDLGVVHYRAWKADDGTLAELPNPHTFAVRLPLTPWSYEGERINIHWLARLRLRYGPDEEIREVLRNVQFTLGPATRSVWQVREDEDE